MRASEQQSPESMPPSFAPSRGTKRAGQADASQQSAPSFAPQARASRQGRPIQSHSGDGVDHNAGSRAAVHINNAGSQGSSPHYAAGQNSAHDATHNAAHLPVSFSPSYSNSRSSESSSATSAHNPPVIHPSGRMGVYPSSSRTPQSAPASYAPTHSPAAARPAGRSMRNANSASARPSVSHLQQLPHGTPGSKPFADRIRRKRRSLGGTIAKSIAWLLVALLALISVFGFASVHWINNHLQHRTWLTSTPSSSATSWLILGSDARDGAAGTGDAGSIEGSRTDTILLLTKPKSGNASLISLPRDSYVQPDGEDMKLNAVSTLLSRKALVETIEDITGYKVNHVVEIGFGGVEGVVDAIGGVRLCYDSNVNDDKSGMVWTAGCHDVNGQQALAFSRMRYQDPQGDIGRQARQRQVIAAIIKKAASPSTLLSPSKLQQTASAGLGSITVDEDTDAFTLAKMALAFRDATGTQGVTGTLYYTDADYYPYSGIGSTVLLDDKRNTAMFQQLKDGTHAPGTVGGLVDDGSSSTDNE